MSRHTRVNAARSPWRLRTALTLVPIAALLAMTLPAVADPVAPDETLSSQAPTPEPSSEPATEPAPTDEPVVSEPSVDTPASTPEEDPAPEKTTPKDESEDDEPKDDVPTSPTPQEDPGVLDQLESVVAAAIGDGTLTVDLTQTTGTGPFDSDDAAGHDSGASNDVIRTNDTIAYKVGIRYEGEDQTNPKITFTLPQGQELVSLPPFCLTGSSITPAALPAPTVPLTSTSYQTLPTQTLVCVVANQTQGTALNYDFLVKVRPEMPNGTTMGPMVATATSDQVTDPASSNPVSQTVSAKANFDLSKRATSTAENTGPLFARNRPCSFDAARSCRVVQYPMTISAAAGGKGTSPLASPITFTDDISPATYYGASTWSAAVAAAGSESAAIEKYAPRYACTGTLDLWGSIPYHKLPGSPSAEDLRRHVRDSGNVVCNQPGGTGTAVEITVTDADTSAYTVPTRAGNGAALPADTAYVVSRQINLEIPVDAVLDLGEPGQDGSSWTLDTENTFTDVVMTDIGGNANSGEVIANNNRKAVVAIQIGYGFNKYFSSPWGKAGNTPWQVFSPSNGSWEGPPGSSSLRDGNFVVLPGQNVISNVFMNFTGVPNSGTQFSQSVLGCDVWDDSKLGLTPGNYAGGGPQNSRPSGGEAAWVSIFTTGNGGTEPISNLNNLEIQYSSGPAGPGADSDCTTGTWYDSPSAVPGATITDGVYTGVNRVRVAFSTDYNGPQEWFQVNLAIGQTVRTNVDMGAIVPNWASQKRVNGVTDLQGIIDDDSVAYSRSVYNPAGHTGAWGDRLRVGGVTARLKKYVKNPTSGEFTDSAVPQYTSGSNVEYRLNPTITADVSAGTKAPVILEDCLPRYQQFVSSKREDSGDPIVPVTVQSGSPVGAELQCAAGETYVKWDLGENTVNETVDPIVYAVEILATVLNGNYINNALVSSEQDPSLASARGDSAQIQVVTPTGIKIAKSTPQSVVEVNPDGVATPRTLKWTVDFANVDAPQDVSDVDVIDVLPADGVGGTDFEGSLAFTSATVAAGTGIEILYTSSPAAGLKVDPSDVTNGATGATVWCSAISGTVVSGNGTAADCPTTASAVTGLRFLRTGEFNPGDAMTIDIVMTPAGNAGGDVYDNITSGRADGVSQPVGPASREISIIESAVGNFVWEDLDSDGVQDAGEPGVPNFPVRLVGEDLDGNPVSLATTTNANGAYSFKALASGTYRVIFDPNGLTSNTTFTQGNAGSDDTLDSDANTTTGETAEITLAPDSQDPDWDAGLVIDRNVKITVDKTFVGQTALDKDNRSTITYNVVVTNSGTAEGTYDLTDELKFGGNIVVESVKAANTTPGNITVDPGFDGVKNINLVKAQKLGGGASHTYRVTVGAQVKAQITAEQRDCVLTTSEQGTGYLNEASLTVDAKTVTDTACGEPPVPPTPPVDNGGDNLDNGDDVLGDNEGNDDDGLLPNAGGPAWWLGVAGLASIAAGSALVIGRRRDENEEVGQHRAA